LSDFQFRPPGFRLPAAGFGEPMTAVSDRFVVWPGRENLRDARKTPVVEKSKEVADGAGWRAGF